MKFTKVYTMNFKRLTLVLLACLILLLCACDPIEDTAEQTPEVIPQYTLPPVEVEALPAEGGGLVFPIPKNPVTRNPLKINNVELHNLFTLIYEKPIRIGVNGKPQPELVETWEWDETGTVWTFHLRKGVQWQRGYGEFTSSDIIYTIEQLRKYSSENSRYARYNNIISSYTAIDNYTVSITLTEPGNAAIYFMTFPVVCKSYCETGSIDSLLPVGTGPYFVVDYDDADRMTLQASEVWWKQQPYIQELTAICYPDHDTELAAFDLNMLNFVTTSVLTVETYKKFGERESVDYLTQYYDCLIPNVSSDIFSDVNVRQAIAYALDKRDIISKALLGHAVATDYPIPLDSYLSGGSTNIYEYNPQRAIELLEQSDWKNRDEDETFEKVVDTQIFDLTFELLIPLNKENTYRLDVAENIKSQLEKVGMDVVVNEEEYDVYLQKLNSKDFDIALGSFYLDDNPDVSFMLGKDQYANYGGFSDANMDALLKNCKTALTDDQMVSAYAALENLFVQQAPQIGLYFKTNALIYDTSITIAEEFRDMNIYTTIPRWYLYTKEAEDKS